MGEADSLEGLLSRLQEQQQREAKGLTGLNGFSSFQGQVPIDLSLELAVLTFVHHRYRNIPQWRIQQTYSFTCEGVFLRTFVESWEAGIPVRFTPEEAIVIAHHISTRPSSQPDGEEW